MRTEIDIPLDLTDREEAVTQMHSFYNVVNVLMTEIQLYQKVAGDRDALAESLALCRELTAAFSDREAALAAAERMETIEERIREEMETDLAGRDLSPAKAALAEESRNNIESVFAVIDVRVREILARQKAPTAWRAVGLEEIEANMRQVFEAIARNAHGRYGIVFDPGAQGADDYLVLLRLQSVDGATIRIPPVLIDTMRDLAANARKYSAPGGRIEVDLVDDGREVTLEVRDEGRGIPAEDVPRIIAFGERGGNVRPEETKGGGFGLTKAYYVCRQHGGRMWIESAADAGCVVRLVLPRPDAA